MAEPHRRLYLLRHAEASRPPAVPDHERPLSPLGCDDAAEIGSYMAGASMQPQMALVSTAARTRSTWAVVQKALPLLVPAIFEKRIYEAAVEDILAAIRATSAQHESLIVVGHNPGMQNLALYLIGQAERTAYARLHTDYPPGSLTVIDFEAASWADVAEYGGTLRRFVTPASQSDFQ